VFDRTTAYTPGVGGDDTGSLGMDQGQGLRRGLSLRGGILLALGVVLCLHTAWEVPRLARGPARLEAEVVDAQVETALTLAAALDVAVGDLARGLAGAARELERAPRDEAGRSRAPLGAMPFAIPADALMLVDPTGAVRAAEGAPLPGVELDAAAIRAALEGGRRWATVPLATARAGAAPALGVVRPIDGGGRWLVAALPLARLTERLRLPDPAPDTIIVVVDERGLCVHDSRHPGHPSQPCGLSDAAVTRAALAGGVARAPRLETGGVTLIGASVPAPSLGWAVGVYRNRRAALAAGSRELLGGAAEVAVLGLALALVAWWVTSQLGRNLKGLRAAAEAVGRGRFDVRVPASPAAELRQVGEAFNAMAIRLARHAEETEASERRARVLAEASAELAASLDYEATLARVARIAVPGVADLCVVDLEEGGGVLRIAVACADPAKVSVADELRWHASTAAGSHPVSEVLREGRSVLVPDVDDAFLVRVAGDARHLSAMRAFGMRSFMCVPLVARGRALGTVSFVAAESGRRYGGDDLRLAEELGRRAGLAVDNARLYREAQAAERRFRELVDGLEAIVWEVDLRTSGALFVSRQVETALGFPKERWVSDPAFWSRCLHPDDRDRVLAEELAARAALRDYTREYRMVTADGRTVWLRDLVRFARGPDGKPERMRGVSVDVTAQRQAESERDRLATFVESSSEAMGLSTLDGRMLFLNEAGRRLVGLGGLDEARRHSIADLVLPQDRAALRDLIVPSMLERGGWRGEFRLRHFQTGAAVPVHLYGFPIVSRDTGRPAALAMVTHDLTELKAAEEVQRRSAEAFRHLIENALDLITVLGPDGTIRYQSPSALRMLGYRPESVEGRSALEFTHPDDVSRVSAELAAGPREPGTIRKVEFRLRHADGGWRTLEAVGRQLPDGEQAGVVIVNSRDVTERKALEEQLRQSQKMEVVGRLAGGVAHDFNNILAAIAGYAELLLAQTAPEDARRREVEEIRRAADRAASLTRQLLAFSRKQVLQPTVLDAGRVVGEMEAMLRRLIGEDVALVLETTPGLGLVRADRAQLEQVVMNLVVNARQAMPRGGTLTIETGGVEFHEPRPMRHGLARAGRYVRLVVRDTGVGMDAETRAHLFEPFFTTKGRGEGTGLGLATVYGIVQQSGGAIEVDSAPGAGATFTIYLPAFEPPAASQAAGEETAAPATPAAAAGGRETVLLAEDDAAVRGFVRTALESFGYTVLEARDGGEALAAAVRHAGSIQILVTDVVMPVMRGPQLASALAERRPETRVLYISGYTEDALGDQGVASPGVAFLAKPFTTGALARKVREVLDAR
jgi:PAS domain S-box-containing protein